MGSHQMRRRRQNLYSIDPCCWYCGILVYEYNPSDGVQHPDQSTLEHMMSRRNPVRREDHGIQRVLACYDCNNARGNWTSALLKADEREQREANIITIGDQLTLYQIRELGLAWLRSA